MSSLEPCNEYYCSKGLSPSDFFFGGDKAFASFFGSISVPVGRRRIHPPAHSELGVLFRGSKLAKTTAFPGFLKRKCRNGAAALSATVKDNETLTAASSKSLQF